MDIRQISSAAMNFNRPYWETINHIDDSLAHIQSQERNSFNMYISTFCSHFSLLKKCEYCSLFPLFSKSANKQFVLIRVHTFLFAISRTNGNPTLSIWINPRFKAMKLKGVLLYGPFLFCPMYVGIIIENQSRFNLEYLTCGFNTGYPVDVVTKAFQRSKTDHDLYFIPPKGVSAQLWRVNKGGNFGKWVGDIASFGLAATKSQSHVVGKKVNKNCRCETCYLWGRPGSVSASESVSVRRPINMLCMRNDDQKNILHVKWPSPSLILSSK